MVVMFRWSWCAADDIGVQQGFCMIETDVQQIVCRR